MRKNIDFPPYTEAEVKEIMEDGSILCDLYGDQFYDYNIFFPSGSSILKLTKKEKEQFASEQSEKQSAFLNIV